MAPHVLLIEDSAEDSQLAREAFHQANSDIILHVASDGFEAMAFLRQEGAHVDAPRPDLIVLDLSLPKMNGREVLAFIKHDITLKAIPTIILTSSDTESDVVTSYQLFANCYLKKPVEFGAMQSLAMHLNDFWLARLSTRACGGR